MLSESDLLPPGGTAGAAGTPAAARSRFQEDLAPTARGSPATALNRFAQETPPDHHDDPDRAAVDSGRMSFLEHLSELRLRLRNAAVVFLVAIFVSFYFVKKYFEFLTRPARVAWRLRWRDRTGVPFLSPTEPFWVYTKWPSSARC